MILIAEAVKIIMKMTFMLWLLGGSAANWPLEESILKISNN